MKTVEEAIKFRRTMPEFDSSKKIDIKDLKTVLDGGRLAPSGLGAESTRVLVVRNKKIKEEINEKAFKDYNWTKVKTADTLLLFVSASGEVFKSREFVQSRIERWGLSEEDLEKRVNLYLDWMKNSQNDYDVYSANQAFIVMSYISLQAAAIGLESVIMQGFDGDKLNDLLQEKGYLDLTKESVHLAMVLGYTNEKIRARIYPQVRMPLDEFCEFIED